MTRCSRRGTPGRPAGCHPAASLAIVQRDRVDEEAAGLGLDCGREQIRAPGTNALSRRPERHGAERPTTTLRDPATGPDPRAPSGLCAEALFAASVHVSSPLRGCRPEHVQNHARSVEVSRDIERSPATSIHGASVVDGIDEGADRSLISRPSCAVERGLSRSRSQGRCCSRAQEFRDKPGGPAIGGLMQRGPPFVVGEVGGRSTLKESANRGFGRSD